MNCVTRFGRNLTEHASSRATNFVLDFVTGEMFASFAILIRMCLVVLVLIKWTMNDGEIHVLFYFYRVTPPTVFPVTSKIETAADPLFNEGIKQKCQSTDRPSKYYVPPSLASSKTKLDGFFWPEIRTGWRVCV